jgi:hypothetical protein
MAVNEARQRRTLSGIGSRGHTDVVGVMAKAWALHKKNGHPEGYDGPCWGPTLEEMSQARVFVLRKQDKARKEVS